MKDNAYSSYSRQFVDSLDTKIVLQALQSKFITQGEYVKKFEKKFSKIVNSKFSCAVNNCTSGLYIVSKCLELNRNSYVIVPSISFASTANAPRLCGSKIIFCDVDSKSGLITPKLLNECIKRNKNKNIKAIFVVHLGGNVVNLKEIKKISNKIGAFLIEDAAHALGSKFISKNKQYLIGDCKYSDFSVFSFHPVKAITTGEGGMITFNNKKYYEKIYSLRSHGIFKKSTDKLWLYDQKFLSSNFRMSDINCALGISQLDKLKKFVSHRRKIAEYYKYYLKKINIYNIIEPVKELQFSYSSFHLLLVKINFKKIKITRDKLMRTLLKKNISTQVHYIPIYNHSYYKKLKYKKLPNTELYYESCLSLPLNYLMKKNDVKLICENLKFVISNNK